MTTTVSTDNLTAQIAVLRTALISQAERHDSLCPLKRFVGRLPVDELVCKCGARQATLAIYEGEMAALGLVKDS